MTKYISAAKQVLALAQGAKDVGSRLGLSKLSTFGSRLHGVALHKELSENGRKYAVETIPTLIPVIDGHIKHVRSDQKRKDLEIYRSWTVPEVEAAYNRLAVAPAPKAEVSELMDCFYELAFVWSQETADEHSAMEESAMAFLGSKNPDYEHIATLLKLAPVHLFRAADTNQNRELKPKIEAVLDRLEVTAMMSEVIDG